MASCLVRYPLVLWWGRKEIYECLLPKVLKPLPFPPIYHTFFPLPIEIQRTFILFLILYFALNGF